MPPRKPLSDHKAKRPIDAGPAPDAGQRGVPKPASPQGAAKPKGSAKPKAAKSKAKKAPKAPKPLEPPLVREIFERFRQAEPEPKGELEYVNPFTLLVAVVLSAQATDVGVNRATRALFAVADTPQKMLDLGEDAVREAIKTIGLFRNKARNVVALSRRLVDEFGGETPRTREELETLPGVGRKTANVVLNTAFGQPTIAVDTHLFRVSNRLPLAPGKTPLDVELGLLRVIPAEYLQHAHHWLILHGRYVCKARKPDCPRCIISDICRFEPKTLPGQSPPDSPDPEDAALPA
ncbi:endonuclease III [Alsobacter sp. KACC 23698]|uniref:Endonuclease III n=1 Tax=Alsobacter sp. KACC 23698 TaxID=3149229 RepID=A0AAU7JFT8_9HYPH